MGRPSRYSPEVPDVMGIAAGGLASRKAALPIARGQRAAQGRGDGAGLAADVEHLPVRTMLHLDGGGVAGQPLCRCG